MAEATVTIKVTPNELQVISSSLRMFAYVIDGLMKNDRAHPLEGYHHSLNFCDNDPSVAYRMANAIRHQIGLR